MIGPGTHPAKLLENPKGTTDLVKNPVGTTAGSPEHFPISATYCIFVFNCPNQRNRGLPWAIFTLKLAIAIFALGIFDFLSGLETLTDRSGSKIAFERNRNQLQGLILRPFHGTFTFSSKSVKLAQPRKNKKCLGQCLLEFQKGNAQNEIQYVFFTKQASSLDGVLTKLKHRDLMEHFRNPCQLRCPTVPSGAPVPFYF